MIDKQLKPINQDANFEKVSGQIYKEQHYDEKNEEEEEEDDEEDIINLDEYVENYDNSFTNEKKDDVLTSAEGTKHEGYFNSPQGSGNHHLEKNKDNNLGSIFCK